MNLKNRTTNRPARRLILGVRGRLYIGFGIISLLLVFAMTLVLLNVNLTENIAQEAIEVDMVTHDTTFDLTLQVSQAQSVLRAWLLTHDPQYKTEFFEAWNNINNLKSTMDMLEKKWGNIDSVQRWQEASVLLSQLEAGQMKIANADMTSNTVLLWKTDILPVANKLLDNLMGHLTSSGDRKGGLLDVQYSKLKTGTSDIISNISIIRSTAYILLILSCVSGCGTMMLEL